MVVLDVGIAGAKGLIMKLLKKLSKMDRLNHVEQDKVKGESGHDEFVFNAESQEYSKTIKEFIYILLDFLSDEINKTSDHGFKKYLAFLKKELKAVISGDLVEKLKSGTFISNLENCLKDILGYCKERQSEGNDSWQKATDSIATITALNPFVALTKLIKIASNSSYPKEIRALAAALINDALSHMKQETVSNHSAKLLLALLNNTPGNVRDLVFSALKDSKIIEKHSRFSDSPHVGSFNRGLTLA